MARTLPAQMTTELAKAGSKPVFLVRIPTAGVYLATRAVTVGAQAHESLLKAGGLGAASIAIDPVAGNGPKGTWSCEVLNQGSWHDALDSYPIVNEEIQFLIVFDDGTALLEAECLTLFRGVVKDLEYSRGAVTLRCVDLEDQRMKLIPRRTLRAADYANVPAESDGEAIPLAFGDFGNAANYWERGGLVGSAPAVCADATTQKYILSDRPVEALSADPSEVYVYEPSIEDFVQQVGATVSLSDSGDYAGQATAELGDGTEVRHVCIFPYRLHPGATATDGENAFDRDPDTEATVDASNPYLRVLIPACPDLGEIQNIYLVVYGTTTGVNNTLFRVKSAKGTGAAHYAVLSGSTEWAVPLSEMDPAWAFEGAELQADYYAADSCAITAMFLRVEYIPKGFTLDGVPDGVYKRVIGTDVNPDGHVYLSTAVGSLDDVDDGDNFKRMLAAAVNAGLLELDSGAGVHGVLPSANTDPDVVEGADRANEGLWDGSYGIPKGSLAKTIYNSVLPVTAPVESGLIMNGLYWGYYDLATTSWRHYFKSDGDALIGDTGTDNYCFWDQSAGTFTIRGILCADDIVTGALMLTAAGVNLVAASGAVVFNAGADLELTADVSNPAELRFKKDASNYFAFSANQTSQILKLGAVGFTSPAVWLDDLQGIYLYAQDGSNPTVVAKAGANTIFRMNEGGNDGIGFDADDVSPLVDNAVDLGKVGMAWKDFRLDGEIISTAGLKVDPGSGFYLDLPSIKTTTGAPTGVEGRLVINTYDNTLTFYADGAWRTLATW